MYLIIVSAHVSIIWIPIINFINMQLFHCHDFSQITRLVDIQSLIP